MGQPDIVLAMAGTRARGDLRHGQHLQETDFRLSLCEMAANGTFPRDAIREAIARDDGHLYPMLVTALQEPADAPVLRWMAGIPAGEAGDRPTSWGPGPASERARALAIGRLVSVLPIESLTHADLRALEDALGSRDPEAVRGIAFSSRAVIERLGDDDARAARLRDALDRIARDRRVSAEVRTAVAEGIASWERFQVRRRP